jgi:hypothetical protein
MLSNALNDPQKNQKKSRPPLIPPRSTLSTMRRMKRELDLTEKESRLISRDIWRRREIKDC